MERFSLIKKPLVSILTCTYNQAPYIEQTIRSVLEQTYQDWEWVILDDGSTDNTVDIIGQFKDSRIRYYLQEHAGYNQLGKTFNKALSMCNGDFIATLDSDDYWPAYKLETQIRDFVSTDSVLSYGETWVVNPAGRKISYTSLPDDKRIANNNPPGAALKELLEKRSCFIVNSTVMYRKSALLNVDGFAEIEGLGQDFPTWIRLSLEGIFSALPVCLGYYRKHLSSSTLSSDPDVRFDNDVKFFRTFIAKHKQKLHELGISYDMDRLEKGWERIKTYLPYNNAMYLLILGSFKEAKAEFKKFLEKHPSLKNRLIYFLIILSAHVNFDMVNPIAMLKEKVRKIPSLFVQRLSSGLS